MGKQGENIEFMGVLEGHERDRSVPRLNDPFGQLSCDIRKACEYVSVVFFYRVFEFVADESTTRVRGVNIVTRDLDHVNLEQRA